MDLVAREELYYFVTFFARGLHTRTAVARLPLRQLGFLVTITNRAFRRLGYILVVELFILIFIFTLYIYIYCSNPLTIYGLWKVET